MSDVNSTFIDSTWSTWNAYTNATPALLAISLIVTLAFVYAIVRPRHKSTDIPELGGFSIITAWPFFTRRFDFMKEGFEKIGGDMFQFRLLQHFVTIVRGEEARKAFFDSRSLSFTEGYKVLVGSTPHLEDISLTVEPEGNLPWFNKQLSILMSKSRLSDVIPTLFDDVQARLDTWGHERTIDPFQSVYGLVFQMTVRLASCRDLSTNFAALDRLQHLYWVLEASATPTAVLLPRFPGRDKKNRAKATQEMYDLLLTYVNERKAAKAPTADAIDLLLGQALPDQDIIAFILAVIFTGVINTGVNACWVLVFLSQNEEWRNKVVREINTLLEKYTTAVANDPLHKRLSLIPITAWEEEMPDLEAVIRETIRLVFCGATLRRNVLHDLEVCGKTVPRGHFMAYQVSDVHLNPGIYTNPTEFDPDRFSAGREEDKKRPYAFLGWGAGRHACTGMKAAKLEIKLITALFVSGYEFDAVDETGNALKSFPRPNYNDLQRCQPIGEKCYFKLRRLQ